MAESETRPVARPSVHLIAGPTGVGKSAAATELAWQLTVRLLPPPGREEYLAALTRRAREMLTPGACGPGLLEELAALWHDPHQRFLAASVNGFEAVLECCAKYSLDVESIDKQHISEHVLDRIAALIAERHAEHGFLQHRVFTEIFESPMPESGFDFGELERAA